MTGDVVTLLPEVVLALGAVLGLLVGSLLTPGREAPVRGIGIAAAAASVVVALVKTGLPGLRLRKCARRRAWRSFVAAVTMWRQITQHQTEWTRTLGLAPTTSRLFSQAQVGCWALHGGMRSFPVPW